MAEVVSILRYSATTEKDDGTPWYRKRQTDSEPFVLSKLICPKTPGASPFLCAAAFPWHLHSLRNDTLYDISAEKLAEIETRWFNTVGPWIGSVAIGSVGCAWIFRQSGPPLCIQVPHCKDEKLETSLERDVKCVAWALDPRTWTTPLVILAAFGMIFVYDPSTRQMISNLRGHGGEITSIAVHHIHPYRFLTSSADQTTRLYDLRYTPRQRPNNPHWPPSKRPSLAGAGFGLHITGPEGNGFGRCTAVLAGGRSGGHQAAVLHVAWHPTADLIATCGADHTVKIWRVPYVDYKKVDEDMEHLAREDKPLFSTNLIHKARVMSIWWLSHDVLVSHSAPALMRGRSLNHMYEEPGTVAVWQWLGYDRYLHEGSLKPTMRGSRDDWRNSESFKLLSVYSVPMATSSIYVWASPLSKHDPLLFVPDGTNIRIFNITRFKHRDIPVFPLDDPGDMQTGDNDDEELENATGAMHLTNADGDEVVYNPEVYGRERPAKELFKEVKGWCADTRRADAPSLVELPEIQSCQVAFGGWVILGVGERGALYSWKLKSK